MDYDHTYSQATIRCYASDMILEIDSDASYLVMTKARSWHAGYFRFLKSQDTHDRQLTNGAILIECK